MTRAHLLSTSTAMSITRALSSACDSADASAAREAATECRNGVDDDRDGRLDCGDSDCAWTAACVESSCHDGLDDDGDGATDCDDTDCGGSRAECDCSDGLDDDSDRAVDCFDTECAATPACTAPEGMVRVTGGEFVRGCDDISAARPAHTASVDDFFFDVDVVKVGPFADCVAAGACTPTPTYEEKAFCTYGPHPDRDAPLRCATWEQQRQICTWRGARLCTESEWDMVMRPDSGAPTIRFQQLSSTMTGAEMVRDCWSPDFGTKHPDGTLELTVPTDGSAYEPANCTARVAKGVGQLLTEWQCRRTEVDPSLLYVDSFVRCCASVP